MIRRICSGLLVGCCLLAGMDTTAAISSTTGWFTIEDGMITGYSGPKNVDIEIPTSIAGETVTGIATNAFGSWETWYQWGQWMYIPDTVEVIEGESLPHLYSGGRVYLPDEVKEFGTMLPGMGVYRVDRGVSYTLSTTHQPVVVEVLSESLGCYYTNLTQLDQLIPVNGLYIDQGVVVHYEGRDNRVEIPSQYQGVPVTGIAKGAFAANGYVEEVILPSSLEEIGESAFSYCKNLRQITLGAGLTQVGDFAFYLTGLEEIHFPTGVESIGEHALTGTNLREVSLPYTVTHLGYGAFAYCKMLEEISISQGITEFLGFFEGCDRLEELEIPTGVTTLADGALASSSLREVEIPATVTHISQYVFMGTDSWGENILPTHEFVVEGTPGTSGEAFALQYGFTFEVAEE